MRKNGFKKDLPVLRPREFFHVCIIKKQSYGVFSFNLKLICTCEFFKKLKSHLPKRLVQFQLFWNLTRANQFQIELETVSLPIQTSHTIAVQIYLVQSNHCT